MWTVSLNRYFVEGCVGTLALMKHATQSTLAELQPLLRRIRAYVELVEKSPGVFYRKSKPFLHFHDDPSGIFADLRLNRDEDFTRFQVDSVELQLALISHIEFALAH